MAPIAKHDEIRVEFEPFPVVLLMVYVEFNPTSPRRPATFAMVAPRVEDILAPGFPIPRRQVLCMRWPAFVAFNKSDDPIQVRRLAILHEFCLCHVVDHSHNSRNFPQSLPIVRAVTANTRSISIQSLSVGYHS